VKVKDPAPTPQCEIAAQPQTITRGDSTTLQWTTSNAVQARINQGIHSVPTGVNKQRTVTPENTTQYTMKVTNQDGDTSRCQTKVKVKDVVRTCDISADVKVVEYGGSVTLSWNTKNFDSVTINGASVAVDGSKTYADITSDTTYRLQATAENGSFNCVTTVTVTALAPPPSCTLETNPSVIYKGDNALLAWTTDNAVAARINRDVGSVSTGSGSRAIVPTQTTTYTMVVENVDGSEATCDAKVKVKQPTPTPVCDLFTANPEKITEGESTTLRWETSNAAQVYIDQGVGTVADDGSKTVTPLETTLYKLTAIGDASKDTHDDECYVKVTVEEPEPELPTCDFSATPTTVPAEGGEVVLAWNTTQADNVQIDNGIGAVARNNSGRTVNVAADTTYTLEASNGDGAVSCDVTVTVDEPTPEPELPTCDFSVDPNSLGSDGGNVTLEWNTEFADTVTINQGIGSVSENGTRMVAVSGTTLFTLTADNSAGSDSCTAKVTVEEPEPDPLTCTDNVSFRVSPDAIDEGESAELRWDTIDVDDVSINRGIGDVAVDGEYTVSPNEDTTYELTASRSNDSVQCSVTLDVDEDSNSGGGGGTVTPRCELEVSDTRIDAGDDINLSWDSRNASDVVITDSNDNEVVTTENRLADDKDELYEGEKTLSPEETTTYTMIAERGSRDDECTVRVRVDDSDIVVLEDRDQQPLVSSIALQETPYTGFDAGPMLASMFYGLLTLWALFVAYVFVRRRNLATVGATTEFTPHSIAEQQRSVNPALFASHQTTPSTTTPSRPAGQSTSVGAPQWSSATKTQAVDVAVLEAMAHQKHVLVSHDAVTYFLQMETSGQQEETFDLVLEYARSVYPVEDGWIVLNIARMQALLHAVA
jgi:sulfur carrier protein ThiS